MKECYLIKIPFNTHGELYSKENSLKIIGYANYIYDINGKETINEYLQLEKANYKVVENTFTNASRVEKFREFFFSDKPPFNNLNKIYIDLNKNQINQINKYFKERCKYTIGTQFSFFQGSAISGEKNGKSSLIHTHKGNQYNFNYPFQKIRTKSKQREKINYKIVKEMGLFDFVNYNKNFREIFEGNNYEFATRKSVSDFKDIAKDLDEIINEPKEETRLRLTDARIGQGKYREEILKKYNNTCLLTGLNYDKILIASHIKAWKDCESNDERISPDNGLLLSASADKLFDQYLISFDSEMKLFISPKFKKQNKNYNDILRKIGIYEDFLSQKESLSNKIIEFTGENISNKTKNFLKHHYKISKNL